MTLVVAENTPTGVRLASDMRLTDRGAAHQGFVNARLKLILVGPTLCIGYAGRDGLAITAIRRVARMDPDPSEAATELLKVYGDRGGGRLRCGKPLTHSS